MDGTPPAHATNAAEPSSSCTRFHGLDERVYGWKRHILHIMVSYMRIYMRCSLHSTLHSLRKRREVHVSFEVSTHMKTVSQMRMYMYESGGCIIAYKRNCTLVAPLPRGAASIFFCLAHVATQYADINAFVSQID